MCVSELAAKLTVPRIIFSQFLSQASLELFEHAKQLVQLVCVRAHAHTCYLQSTAHVPSTDDDA